MENSNPTPADLLARALLALMDLPEIERRAQIESAASKAYHDAGNFDRPAMILETMTLARFVLDQGAGDYFDLATHYAGCARRGGDDGMTKAEAEAEAASCCARADAYLGAKAFLDGRLVKLRRLD